MLFHPKNRKTFELVWKIICLVVVIAMVLLYIPALF